MLKEFVIAILFVGTLSGLAEDAPSHEVTAGSIGGTVQDVSGGVVPGALVTLKCPLPCTNTSTTTSDLGGFEFRNPALDVRYQITVTAAGFKDWTSTVIVLKPEKPVSLNEIKLELADVADSVTVYSSQEQIAAEQVHIEEQQRVLGIIPNFYVVYDTQNTVPLSARLKFKLAMRVSLDPVTVTGIGFLAGMQQAGSNLNYPQGAKGYAQRFGADAAGGFSDILIGGAVLPSLLHQDPRYFYRGAGTTSSRLKHALSSPFIGRGDNGRPEVNFSSMGGDLASSALSNLYYPESNRGAGMVFGNFAISTGERLLSAVLQEFVLNRFTSGARQNH